MKLPLKLNAIEQEHLQELYDAAGVARDELPYSQAFEQLCQDFQNRTFKNADPEQVFGAILKYVRSSSCASTVPPTSKLSDEQLKQLKDLLRRHGGGKVLPYSSEFDAAVKEFAQLAKVEITSQEFWQAIIRMHGPKRRPPTRAKAVASSEESDDSDE